MRPDLVGQKGDLIDGQEAHLVGLWCGGASAPGHGRGGDHPVLDGEVEHGAQDLEGLVDGALAHALGAQLGSPSTDLVGPEPRHLGVAEVREQVAVEDRPVVHGRVLLH